ncbi:MAG: signal peptidase I, partial [Rickettsiales bacterium]|nr:signal peptidase I [Rickettsiales bacterium]
IGLPGDRVRVYDGRVFINGEQLDQEDTGVYADNSTGIARRIKQYKETMPNGQSYHTLDETGFGEVDFTEEITVPEGQFFVMGDNRDNSVDSRYPDRVGLIPEENLIGRAEMILFSIDRSVQFEFWEFWRYGEMFRPERFFLRVENA